MRFEAREVLYALLVKLFYLYLYLLRTSWHCVKKCFLNLFFLSKTNFLGRLLLIVQKRDKKIFCP